MDEVWSEDAFGNVVVHCPCCGTTVVAAPENMQRLGTALELRWPTEMREGRVALDMGSIPMDVDLTDRDVSAADIARVVRTAARVDR